MYRHIRQSCKKKDEVQDNNDLDKQELLKKFAEMQEQINRLEDMNEKLIMMSNNSKTIKTINGTNVEGDVNVVNNIMLIGYGREDFDRIDRNDLLKGFRTGFNSTLNLIDAIHFNPKYPEFHNVYISSMKNKYAMMYDGNDWTLVMKDDLIDKMYDNKRDYIEENLDDFLDSLTPSQQRALHRWLNVDDDHHYIKKIKNDIKLLLYNKRKMPLNNKLQNAIKMDNNEAIDLDDSNVKVIKVPKDSSNKKIIKNTNQIVKQSSRPLAGRPGTKRKPVRTR